LQMYECPGKLDETLVKISVRAMPVFEPQILQHVMRLVEKPAVEAVEIAEVMRVEFMSPEGFDHRGNAGAFVAHGFILDCRRRGDETHSEGKVRDPSRVSYVLLRNQPEETAAVGWRNGKLVVQVGKIERGRVRNVRPRNQIGTLL
jgi:hypothetical protein